MSDERLMIPGPIQLSPEVLAEMTRPMAPHYGSEWTAFYNETVERVKPIYGTSGDVYLIPGSGSAALDAAIGSSLGEADKMLILSNGFFGQRLSDIARRYKANSVVLSLPDTEPLSVDALRRALMEDPEITVVGAVHSESSSGLLNPIRELASVCRERDVLFLVDAVSSLGAIDVQMDAWDIDLCISASQKCLEGPPGLGLVAVGERAWERIKACDTPGWYLNLRVWKDFAETWGDWHPHPVTMPVPVVRAFRCGIERVLSEGLPARFERHRRSAKQIRTRLGDLGFQPVFAETVATPTVVALHGQPNLCADDVVARLDSEYRIKIARGMGAFAGEAFRIGNMGPQAMPDQINPLLDAMKQLLDVFSVGG